MSTKQAIESLQSDFQHWRQNKTGLRTRVPEHLRKRAVNLLSETAISKITKAASISSAMLKSWADKQKPSMPAPAEFTTLQVDLPPTPDNEDITLSFTPASGGQWCLQGCVNSAQISTFINAVSSFPGGAQ